MTNQKQENFKFQEKGTYSNDTHRFKHFKLISEKLWSNKETDKHTFAYHSTGATTASQKTIVNQRLRRVSPSD